MSPYQSAQEVIAAVRNETDSCILFLSLGKDSLVTLDLIYPHFKHIVCVFMYFVPHLEHIERWIRWVKATYPDVEIMQVPHWNLTYILRGGLYCTPRKDVKLMRLADVIQSVRLKTGLEYVFLGMKKADGMNRNMMLKTYEENHYINNGLAYPLAEWNQKQIWAYMRQRRLPEAVRYGLSASSGVGFNEDCFVWMEQNFPQDLERIYKVFPMSFRILAEYHYKEKKEEQNKQKENKAELEENHLMT